MLYLIFIMLLAMGLFWIMAAVLRLPSPESAKAIRNARGKSEKWGRGIETVFVMPLARFFSRFVVLSALRRDKMADDLVRMDVDMTPEVYTARAFVQAVVMTAVGVPFVFLIAPWTMFVFVALGVVLFIRSSQDEQKKISAIDEKIETELVRMIEVMKFTMQENRDLIGFFERYLLVAGSEMKSEIERLLFDMKSGNTVAALTRFKSRIRLYTVGEFVSACIGIAQGLDYGYALDELMKNVLKMEEERYRQELDARPRKMFPAHAGMFIAMGMLIGVPFIMKIFGLFEQL
jgi:hypothetical protein